MAAPVNWIEIQNATFAKWCNVQIEKAGFEPCVNDLFEDLKDGTNLVRVLEGCTGNKYPYKLRRASLLKIQQIETLNNAFKFMSENGVKLVNIGPTDISDGKPKLVLGMIWSLISNFSIVTQLGGEGTAKDLLLAWINDHLDGCDRRADNFKESWADGVLLHHLTNCIGKEIYNGETLNNDANGTAEALVTAAMKTASEKLCVPALITAKDMYGDVHDEHSIMVYLAQFQTAKKTEPQAKPKGDHALGATEKTEPTKETKKETPQQKNYVPPAQRKSEWRKYEGVDLGGRCKIRVFFSTTTSDQTIRQNTIALQELLESLKVHEREDFEPWIPVDIDMEREFRNKIFEKAGTRKTPLVFIDDEYVGDYDEVVDLEKSGQLAKLLAY